MRYVSLFSGCGLLDLGLERAGWSPVLFCERDKPCQEVLAHHWPGVTIVDDVRDVAADADLARLEGPQSTRRRHLSAWSVGVDLVVGGFPCQPVSYAGKRQAQADDRWLWPQMARVIRQLRPRLVLVENVPGLATAGLGDVLGDLHEAGFDAEWFPVRASDVGAPHKRERLFIVAALADAGSAGARRDTGAALVEEEPSGWCEQGDADASEPCGATAAGASYDGLARGWGARERRAGSQDGGEKDARMRRVQQIRHSGRDDGDVPDLLRGVLRRPPVESRVQWGAYEPAIRRWEHVVGPAPAPTDERGRLMPAFVEWMMGAPAGWTEGVSRTQQLKMLGNGVQVQVAELIGRELARLV